MDASLYYLAVMLEGGEDPRFIARRMVIFASEDVGNADPQALLIATAAAQAVDRVGPARVRAQPRPGRRLPGAGAEVERLDARRSRGATAHVREHGAAEPPPYLQDAHYPGAKQLGRGAGYRYPHDEPGAVSDQPLAPEARRAASASTSRPTAASRPSSRERLERLRERLGGGPSSDTD